MAKAPPLNILAQLEGFHSKCNPKCVTMVCKRKGTRRLVLPDGKTLGIDCDNCYGFPSKNETRPDYIVLYFGKRHPVPRWLVLEILGPNPAHPSEIAAQLQAGANVVQNDSRFRVTPFPAQLLPIILHHGNVRTADFARRRIAFLGTRPEVRLFRFQDASRKIFV